MEKILTYQTSFTKDKYLIFSGNTQIGKLYKKEWLGSPVESTINDHRFKFVSTGLLQPGISVFDKDSNETIGTVTINSFKLSPSATLRLHDNKVFRWKTKEIFSHDWEWFDLSDMKIVASSQEPLGLFTQSGTISITPQDTKDELLIALGIHLRNVAQKQSQLIRILSFIAFAMILPRLFSLFSS